MAATSTRTSVTAQVPLSGGSAGVPGPTAVYNDREPALADLGALEQLHKAEMFGKYDATRALDAAEAPLIAVGEPTLEKGFARAITRAAKTAKRELNAATDELAKDLMEAVQR